MDGKGSFERLPFLQAKHVSKSGTRVKIIAVRDAGGLKFSDYVLDVAIGTKKYSWPQRIQSGNTRAIATQLKSTNTDKWIGKTITAMSMPWFNNRTHKKQQIVTVKQ